VSAGTMAQGRTHRIAVAGASGRMGHMLIEAVNVSTDCLLTGALDVAASPAIGLDATAFSPGLKARLPIWRSAVNWALSW